MNRSIYLIFPVLLLLVTSCASLKLNPPSPDKQTILVLPVQVTNTTQYTSRHGFYYVYEIAKADESITPYEAVFKLPIKGDMLIVDSLPPGNYFVDKFTFLPIGAANHSYGNKVQHRNDKFELKLGKITIFPKSLNVKLWNKTPGRGRDTTYSFDIVPVSLVQKEEILAALKNLQNIDKWEVLAIEESVQEPGGLRVIQKANQILNQELPIMIGETGSLDSISISETSKEYNLTMTFFDKAVSDMEEIISKWGKDFIDSQLSEPMCDSFRDSKEWKSAFEGYAINVVIRDKTNKVLSEFKCD